MARSVVYRLTTASLGTASGLGEIEVPVKGTIYQVVIRVRATGGAGAGYLSTELGLNSSSQSYAETQYPNRFLSLAAATFSAGNAAANAITTAPIPIKVQLNPGDRLTINTTQTGTAFASGVIAFDVYVME